MYNQFNELFIAHGWGIIDQETTAGARKTWFQRTTSWSRDKVIEVLQEAGFPAKKFTDDFSKEIQGTGFEIILQHPNMEEVDCEKSRQMVIAVHAGSKAKDYARGVDC